MNGVLKISIELKNDFPIDIEYNGKSLNDDEKLMLLLATKSLQDTIYEKFELNEFIEKLQNEAISTDYEVIEE